MGDVHNGTLALMLFSVIFCILFPIIAYPISQMKPSGSTSMTQLGAGGNVAWSDLGVTGLYIYQNETKGIIDNFARYYITLGLGQSDQMKYEYHWDGAPNNYIVIKWWKALGLDFLSGWGWMDLYCDASSYTSTHVNNTEIINAWVASGNYSKLTWRANPLQAGTQDLMMFIYDNNRARNDIVLAINVDKKIDINIAKGITTLAAPSSMDFGAYFIAMLTFQDVFGLGSISWMFTIVLYLMNILAIISSIIVIKALVSGWL